MKTIKTPIIPVKPQYVGVEDELDYKAICIFAATNFFLEGDTHFKGKKCLQPGTIYEIEDEIIISQKSWFEWTYNPRNVSFNEVLDEYTELLDRITEDQLKGKRVILPLSGGLDSRSQAAVLSNRNDVYSYSYEYPNGVKETRIAEKVAKAGGLQFQKYIISKGYLWDNIESIAELLDYSADVTSPRQASVVDALKDKGDILYLGHWGDVLFDDMGVLESISFDELVATLRKKIVKKGGLMLAESLWQAWGLSGSFEDELTQRLEDLLREIKISNNNARVRAFKSMYWAPRWTSVSLSVFSDVLPVALPYYDDRMCKFITTVPEEYLAGRKIQIEHVKKKSPSMASVPWQPFAPYNLYNYNRYTSLTNLFRRGGKKMVRVARRKDLIQRNWEIQFLGEQNDTNLKRWLFENDKFNAFIPKELSRQFYDNFKTGDKVANFHPVSTLLTLSLFAKNRL